MLLFPVMEVYGVDDEASPLLRITVTCSSCRTVVSDRTYDASDRPADEIVRECALVDGQHYVQHVLHRHDLTVEDIGDPVVLFA